MLAEIPLGIVNTIVFKELYYSISVGIGILMGLVIAFKRLNHSRQLIPVLTGHLATAAGCAFGCIIKITHFRHN
jgi:hypothetical protein